AAGALLLRNSFKSKPAAGVATPATSTGSEQSTTLAVLPFTPIEGNRKLTALGQGLVESVSAKLSRLTGDRALEVIPARNLQDRGVSTLADARSQFGANVGLVVTLEDSGQLLRVNYSLVNARSGAAVG